MITIKREMQTKEVIHSKEYYSCKASLNSDGVITLRNYDESDRSNDEIRVLSRKETQAIFALMRTIKNSGASNTDIPF